MWSTHALTPPILEMAGFLMSIAGWLKNHRTKVQVCSCYTFKVINENLENVRYGPFSHTLLHILGLLSTCTYKFERHWIYVLNKKCALVKARFITPPTSIAYKCQHVHGGKFYMYLRARYLKTNLDIKDWRSHTYVVEEYECELQNKLWSLS